MANETNIDWKTVLEEEGMPEELPDDGDGSEQHDIGGLGVKSLGDEENEDNGGHSSTCPLNLGHSISNTEINQPNDRPVEATVINES